MIWFGLWCLTPLSTIFQWKTICNTIQCHYYIPIEFQIKWFQWNLYIRAFIPGKLFSDCSNWPACYPYIVCRSCNSGVCYVYKKQNFRCLISKRILRYHNGYYWMKSSRRVVCTSNSLFIKHENIISINFRALAECNKSV